MGLTMKLALGGMPLAFALATAVCSTSVSGPDSVLAADQTSDGPTITLLVEPRTAGSRTYDLRAEIVGGDDQRLYCLETTWGFGDGPAIRVTPSCAPWTPNTKIQRQFSASHVYKEPGRYVITFGYGSLTASRTIDVG